MKIWKISQDTNTGYDIYSDAVVIAETEQEARSMNPDNHEKDVTVSWVIPEYVMVELIGEAIEGSHKGFVCKSFHAG